ncbi:GroES-like protein [Wolfiporia cocos MD-104 SS10]|uniref:GroES-like protein n=1 Tax=Wolfiporia cocos (strain MD-104) TaxID=742152 RepID=A0A2H3JJH8_WOLCO|nr:GroES-like protein [Wolfiporia cocos MD-104 SS10]
MPIPTTTREYRLPKVDGFHNLTLQEAPLRTPKSSEVLVKIHAVSFQYRDLIVAKGQYPLSQKENPVPGPDMAGEIIATGGDVKGWKVGDRVCANFALDHVFGDATDESKATGLGAPIDGVLTEYRLFPAHSCAMLTTYNALKGLRPLKGGDYVRVQGTGGVSIFGLQFAVASGATVIATSSSDKKPEITKKLGARHLINYKTPDWEKEVLKIMLIEVGGPGTIMKSLASVRYAGIANAIGFGGDMSSLPVAILGKSSIVRGILIGSRTQFKDMNRPIVAQNLEPVIDRVFSFEDVRTAYEYQESRQHVGKVVTRVPED